MTTYALSDETASWRIGQLEAAGKQVVRIIEGEISDFGKDTAPIAYENIDKT